MRSVSARRTRSPTVGPNISAYAVRVIFIGRPPLDRRTLKPPVSDARNRAATGGLRRASQSLKLGVSAATLVRGCALRALASPRSQACPPCLGFALRAHWTTPPRYRAPGPFALGAALRAHA